MAALGREGIAKRDRNVVDALARSAARFIEAFEHPKEAHVPFGACMERKGADVEEFDLDDNSGEIPRRSRNCRRYRRILENPARSAPERFP